MDYTQPIKLSRATAWRTYIGGKLIAQLHGEHREDGNFPEEWLMSTVAARNSGREDIVEGISFVEGTDITLADVISQNPEKILGSEHYKRFGDKLGVLIKLIDSAERLTIQVHPTREMARKLFDSEFGKTECWYILDGREIDGEKPCIYIGFKEGITRKKWQECFEKQDIEEMLSCLHRIDVKKGDIFIIHGGVPHAIGGGCFLVEIQEPTDYTIRTEKITPAGLQISDFMCHQGIGFEKMFYCFDYNGFSSKEVIKKWSIKPNTKQCASNKSTQIISYKNTSFFKLDLVEIYDEIILESNDQFSGIYVLAGFGKINGRQLEQCDQYFISACCEKVKIETLNGSVIKILRFYGPERF